MRLALIIIILIHSCGASRGKYIYFKELEKTIAVSEITGTMIGDTINDTIVKVWPSGLKGNYRFEKYYINGNVSIRGQYRKASSTVRDSILYQDPSDGQLKEGFIETYYPVKTGVWEYYYDSGILLRRIDFGK